jgi:SAD/SRA domain
MVAKVNVEPANKDTSVQLASPATSCAKVLLSKDEAETSAILHDAAIEKAAEEADLDRQLTEISEEMSQPCRYEQGPNGPKIEPFHNAFIRNLRHVKKEATEEEKFRYEKEHGLLRILTILQKKQDISSDFVDKTGIELILRVVTDTKWRFSIINRTVAEGLYQRFSSQNWGKVVAESSNQSSTHQDSEKKGKRKRDASSPSPKIRKEKKAKEPVDDIHISEPLPDHSDPIFGLTGPMRGTLIRYNTIDPHNVSKSLVLNPSLTKANCKVYGHNNIPMGQIFLRQLAALAQGAHGSSQGGIAGNPEDGAYSIIVTAHYSSLEKDTINRVEYCAPGSMDNTFKDSLIESQGLKTLRTSKATRKPVRVLRGKNKDFPDAPAFGFRYDGLYRVVEETRRLNDKGGLYAVFVLERMEGQEPVDLRRPNATDLLEMQELGRRLGGE